MGRGLVGGPLVYPDGGAAGDEMPGDDVAVGGDAAGEGGGDGGVEAEAFFEDGVQVGELGDGEEGDVVFVGEGGTDFGGDFFVYVFVFQKVECGPGKECC